MFSSNQKDSPVPTFCLEQISGHFLSSYNYDEKCGHSEIRKKEERIWEKVIINTKLPENLANAPEYAK